MQDKYGFVDTRQDTITLYFFFFFSCFGAQMEFAQISMRAEMALFSLPLRHLEAPNGVDHQGRNDVLLSVSVSTFAHNSLKKINKKNTHTTLIRRQHLPRSGSSHEEREVKAAGTVVVSKP